MNKILCYIYDGMADFEISLLLHILNNNSNKEIITISETTKPIIALSGLQYIANKRIDTIDNISDFEALIIPGGAINNEQNEITDIVKKMVNEKKLVSAICFAPQFFGRSGILNNYKFTTSCSPEKIKSLGCEDPFNWDNYIESRVVIDRNVITAKGYAFVDFAEKVCDYLEILISDKDRYEKIGRIKEN